MPDFDVVLFSKYSFHDSCLGPIAEELGKLRINFWMTGKRHLVYDLFNEREKKFKIFVIADEWGNLFRDCSEILITTGHSLASKRTTLDSKNKGMDYIYCPSQYYKTEFIKRGVIPNKEIIVTGYPASSKLFRREIKIISEWSKRMISSRPKILFAPTYNKDLSIMDALISEEKYSNLFWKMEKMYSIAFKLHPVLSKKYPEHAEFVKHLSEKYSNIYYHDDSHSDISGAILWADIVVGDCSGALLLAAAGGRPIVAFDNPNRKKSLYYDETGPEWVFRDEYAYRMNTKEIANLPLLLEEISKNDYMKDVRNMVVNLLFEHQTDAEKVIANNIAGLLGHK